ncbi:S1 family peptidase [Nocardia harenae]|uniref:S1 family peptidase n=1 Tax=Nocardia harenae TaxID=358707 RepID=UPI0008337A2C|nr:S1 family peptidase [Nocardia harenae]
MNRSLARTVTAGAALALVPLGAGAAAAQDAPVPVGGGSGIVVGNTAQCTVTTIGYDAAGRLVGLTAGHCGDAGATVVAERDHDLGVVGRFVHSDPNLDYAVIQFDPAKVTPVNRVGNATITGIGAPAQFPAVVCKKGRTSGETCGVAWGDVLNTAQETWTQLCVLEGDSGAPVMVGSTLVGMVNAYLAIGCLGPEVGTTMAAIVADLDARGAVGAGFHPL